MFRVWIHNGLRNKTQFCRLSAGSLIPGQTVERTGTAQQLTAYRVKDGKRKCVVAIQNKLIDKYEVTTVANTVEAD